MGRARRRGAKRAQGAAVEVVRMRRQVASLSLGLAPAGTNDSPRGVPSRLIKNADNSFTLWNKDGSREVFTSAGQVSSLVDKNGNALTLTYT